MLLFPREAPTLSVLLPCSLPGVSLPPHSITPSWAHKELPCPGCSSQQLHMSYQALFCHSLDIFLTKKPLFAQHRGTQITQILLSCSFPEPESPPRAQSSSPLRAGVAVPARGGCDSSNTQPQPHTAPGMVPTEFPMEEKFPFSLKIRDLSLRTVPLLCAGSQPLCLGASSCWKSLPALSLTLLS